MLQLPWAGQGQSCSRDICRKCQAAKAPGASRGGLEKNPPWQSEIVSMSAAACGGGDMVNKCEICRRMVWCVSFQIHTHTHSHMCLYGSTTFFLFLCLWDLLHYMHLSHFLKICIATCIMDMISFEITEKNAYTFNFPYFADIYGWFSVSCNEHGSFKRERFVLSFFHWDTPYA